MQISTEGLNFITALEGKHEKIEGGKYKAYLCPAGVWTIYVGLTHGVYKGMVVTEGEGQRMLLKEIARFEDAVEKHVHVKLNQNQFDALVSFVFNVGINAFRKSTLLKVLNRGDFHAVRGQMMRWTKATVKGKKVTLRGLVIRREAEIDLFYQVDRERSENVPYMPQSVEPTTGRPLPSVIRGSRTIWMGLSTLIGTIGMYVSNILNFVNDVTYEVTEKMSASEAFFKVLPLSYQEFFLVMAVLGGVGVVLVRLHAAREQKEG